jgi:hypothetical protein
MPPSTNFGEQSVANCLVAAVAAADIAANENVHGTVPPELLSLY